MSSFLKDCEEYLNNGNPVIREWFLVNSYLWPFVLCSMYLLIVKVIGPAIMQNRKPFELKFTMLLHNVFLVTTYTICLSATLSCVRQKGSVVLCRNLEAVPGTCEYTMFTAAWVVYLVKYVEFLDTIFFLMRKKYRLITNLHVIHHTVLPLIGWVLLRTEKSGFQAYPIMINSVIHIVMYTYYALAALGPGMKKYLWWKRYLTIAQMTQFVFILMIEVIIKPLSGCSTAKSSRVLNLVFATLFLSLFYNFYQKTFMSKDKQTVSTANGTIKETVALYGSVENKEN